MKFLLVCLLLQTILMNNCLQHLHLAHSLIGDAGCLAICKSLRCLPNILTLDLTGCELTPLGAEYIADLVKVRTLFCKISDPTKGALRRK